MFGFHSHPAWALTLLWDLHPLGASAASHATASACGRAPPRTVFLRFHVLSTNAQTFSASAQVLRSHTTPPPNSEGYLFSSLLNGAGPYLMHLASIQQGSMSSHLMRLLTAQPTGRLTRSNALEKCSTSVIAPWSMSPAPRSNFSHFKQRLPGSTLSTSIAPSRTPSNTMLFFSSLHLSLPQPLPPSNQRR